MKYWIFATILISFVLILKILENALKRNSNQDLKYTRKSLLTKNESKGYYALKELAEKHDLLLFAKVRMIDIVTPETNSTALKNKVIQKHLDFVVTDKFFKTICVIELDDSSHLSKSAEIRDRVKDEALKSADIPLYRYTKYNEQEIEDFIISYL